MTDAVRRIFPLYTRAEPQFRCFVDGRGEERLEAAQCLACTKPHAAAALAFCVSPSPASEAPGGGKTGGSGARRLPRQNLDVKRFPRQNVRSQPPITPAYHRVRNPVNTGSDRASSTSRIPRGAADLNQ